MKPPRFAVGFTSLNQEVDLPRLPMIGRLPDWLTGVLLRNGPAGFEAGDRPLNHWFDGWAMLHTYRLQDGAVSYANRWVTSVAGQARCDGRLRRREFASDPPRPWWSRWHSLIKPAFTDNAGVSVVHAAGHWLALTETPEHIIFDPVTLSTKGVFRFTDRQPGDLITAHPIRDAEEGCLYWQTTALGLRSSYHFLRLRDGSEMRELVATIPTSHIAYLHSWAMTRSRLVLSEFPLLTRPLDLALAGTSFMRTFRWQSERGTLFHIADKHTGVVRTCHTAEPLFALHHINACDDGDSIQLDLCAHEDASILANLDLKRLHDGATIREAARWRRYRLCPSRGTVERLPLPEIACEFPRLMPNNDGRPCPWAWTVGPHPERRDGWPNRLLKLNLLHPEIAADWYQDGCYPGEPVPVPRPGARAADDGVVLSVVLDTSAGHSFLLVLDASDLHELARVQLPHMVPFGFHGEFVVG